MFGEKSGNRKGKRITVISALKNSELLAPMYFEGNTNTEVFNTLLTDFLLPNLKKNQVVIMDNATFHRSETIKKLIESANCKLLYLPPYSPDLNQIEKKWRQNMVKKIRDQFADFNDCFKCVLWYQ